ncbi:MAG: hypothetical protein JRD68_13395 [Deltaproteobacteria bacterium]|nr:hypothetical protein [Deltaproteobacteria bacterium]
MNNMLSGIVGYPDLILMDLSEDDPLKKMIITIQKSGLRAASIVQDMLTLARRGVTTTEVANVNTVISEYLNSPEHKKLLSFHPGVELKTEFEPDLLNILGSPVHLAKTVMNLVSNAAESMPDDGTIWISTENKYIDRAINGYDDVIEGDYVALTVTDNGSGISPEDKERIFEPFYTKKAMGRSGTGLGMAVVWGTVKDHNGYIDVKSAEGQGSAFTLYLPITREALPEAFPALDVKDYRGSGELVLVVDDIADQREIA